MKPSSIRNLVVLLLALTVLVTVASNRDDNDFDLGGSLIPADEIHLGGPPRDGIPAIDRPTFVAAGDVDFLGAEDRVLGLVRGDQAKAYPVAILNWHEIVNDHVGQEPVAITYCPLCGTGMAFAPHARGKTLTFGVSGLLYNSDMLLYDRETESLWSQLRRQAVTGPLKGKMLTALPLTHTTWQAWAKQHPKTLVLSTNTGFRRDYGRSPYGNYASESTLFFPVRAQSSRYHPKEQVLGIEIGGQFKAYPFAELSRTDGDEIADQFAGQQLTIRFDATSQTARAFDDRGEQLPAVVGFWFAWYAFHPDTAVFTARGANR